MFVNIKELYVETNLVTAIVTFVFVVSQSF